MKHLMAIQAELKAPKGQYNSFGKYKYRSAEDILESVKPLCHKNDSILTLSDTLENIGDRYYIKATAKLITPDSTFEVTAYAREDESKKGMDGSQITGTASSYARKYALNGLFCIDDTKDADTDAYKLQQDKPMQPNKGDLVNRIQDLAKKKKVAVKNICEQGGVKSLSDMPITQMQSCITWLEGM